MDNTADDTSEVDQKQPDKWQWLTQSLQQANLSSYLTT